MKKLLFLLPTLLLGLTFLETEALTPYEEENLKQAQEVEQVTACADKKEGAICEYSQIKKVVCDPILIGGALNPCKVTQTDEHKIKGTCQSGEYPGGTLLDSRFKCQKTTRK